MNKGLRERFSGGSFANTKIKLNKKLNGGLRIRGKRIRFLGLGSTFALALIAAATVAPLQEPTQYTEAATGTAQESWLGFGDSAHNNATVSPNLNLTVSDSNGTFVTTDGNATGGNVRGSFAVATNNVSGYYLTISASDDSGELVNTDAQTKMDSIESEMTADQFNVAANNGKWGYKPSVYMSGESVVDNGDTSLGKYLSAPTTMATPLDKTSERTSAATSQAAAANTDYNNYTIDLAARLQYTQASGDYTKTFVLNIVANPVN